eukprot:9577658-Heterocapsa_arctica.AAC.1
MLALTAKWTGERTPSISILSTCGGLPPHPRVLIAPLPIRPTSKPPPFPLPLGKGAGPIGELQRTLSPWSTPS